MKNASGGSRAALRRPGRWAAVALAIVLTIAVPPVGRASEANKRVVHLYFADASKPFLVSEERVMLDSGDPVHFGRQLVTELINGPVTGGKLATIPRETRLRAFYLLADGTAVVDFSVHLGNHHPGSCRREQLTLFSVVNSLALNVPAIDRVKIVIDGAEAETLTGHLALAFPLTADMLLTR